MRASKLFTWPTLILVAAGLCINYVCAHLAALCGWPLFLDSIGTILAAALGGPLPGIIVGFTSNCINSLSNPITLYYGILSIIFALITAYYASRGAFLCLKKTLLIVPLYAVVGGGLGSLMTWALYGLNFGDGVSAPLAQYIFDALGWSKFVSQLIADLGIDLLDKLITLLIVFAVIRLFSPRISELMPFGDIYSRGREQLAPPFNGDDLLFDPANDGKISFSLKNKLALLIIIATFLLSAISVFIGYIVYREASDQRYVDIADSAVTLMAGELDGDQLAEYAATLRVDEEYLQMQAELYRLRDSLPDITFMYVLQTRDEDCLVLFDLQTDEVEASPLGTIWPYEQAFVPFYDQLRAGEMIEPVISNDMYGWLLTVYRPIYDRQGECVAYAAVDISMEEVRADRFEFIMRMISLLFGVSMIIIFFTIWFAQQKLVQPIKKMTEAAEHFVYETENYHIPQDMKIDLLQLGGGDEIEALRTVMLKTAEDISGFIDQIHKQNDDIAEKAAFINRLQDNIIISFADMVENRDSMTGGHIRRTAEYVNAIAEELRDSGHYTELLSDEYLEDLRKSAPLHDIGKIKISDTILNKPGKLTAEEFEQVKTHTTAGRDILSNVLVDIERGSYLSLAIEMALYHHERWDGGGYPEGLRGEEIPLSARIMALADVFDALLSKRTYKEAFGFEQALAIIMEESGRQFDPLLVTAFGNILPRIRKISEHNPDQHH